MATEFFVPKLGQTVEQVTLVKWLVEDGAKVDFGQEVCEVETDKAIFPVEANAKGYIHLGPFKEGDVLPVLTVIAVIGKPDEKFEAAGVVEGAKSEGGATPSPALESPSKIGHQPSERFSSPRARKLAAEKGVDLSQVKPSGYGGIRVVERDVVAHLAAASGEAGRALPKATPLATRIAADVGVDLRAIAGSGPSGKIVKADVTRAAQPSQPGSTPPDEVVERIPLKGVRAIIAERMAASIHTGARVTLFAEADATEFVAARERLKAKVAESWGFAPGYNDLLIKICAAALRQFPYMNARLATDAIEILRPIHIGLAVDTERGLLVPVLRDADQKGLRQLGGELRQMVDRARAGRSLPDDLSGGTFTITNLGMYDIDYFTPVINLPEAAILAVGRIAPKVIPFQGQAVIRQMTTLSLAFDHRLVDGAPAARFLQAIKQMIEEPYLLLAI